MKKAHLHLIKWGIARDYAIAVYIEGEYEGIYKTYNKAKEAVEAGEIGCIDLVPRESVQDRTGLLENDIEFTSFAYVREYDQKPDEIIYDMTDNETARQWLEDYEKEA